MPSFRPASRPTRLLMAALLSLAPVLGTLGCGPAANNNVTTDLLPTTTTLTTSAVLLNSGTTLTLTATIAPTAATGSVAFFDGTTGIGIAQLTNGIGTLQLSTLAIGTHSITVGYGGSSTYYASNSGAISVQVM